MYKGVFMWCKEQINTRCICAHLVSWCFSTGFLLLLKVILATVCVTLVASLALRLGTTSMVAFKICLHVWLTYSLLADGLAVAG